MSCHKSREFPGFHSGVGEDSFLLGYDAASFVSSGIWRRVICFFWDMTPRHSFILWSVLRQAHSLAQSQFPTQCDLMLPLTIYSIPSFLWDHTVTAYVFFPVFPSLQSNFPLIMCFSRQFLRKMWPIRLAFLIFIVCRIFFPSWFYVILHFSHDRPK